MVSAIGWMIAGAAIAMLLFMLTHRRRTPYLQLQLDELQPLFEQQTGYRLTILSQGSGAALKTGERGEADVVLAHSPDAELQFMSGGHGSRRELVMHNDFIIVGPARDPAALKSVASVRDAMQKIATSETPFISRGDNSGTHALELKLWQEAGVDPKGKGWYQESGSGMGQTSAHFSSCRPSKATRSVDEGTTSNGRATPVRSNGLPLMRRCRRGCTSMSVA